MEFLQNNIEIEAPIETLTPNDIVVVNPGEIIPIDGTIIKGIALSLTFLKNWKIIHKIVLNYSVGTNYE